MRTHLQIDLGKHNVKKETVSGEDLAKAGRYHIVKSLLERGTEQVDPLSPENPLTALPEDSATAAPPADVTRTAPV